VPAIRAAASKLQLTVSFVLGRGQVQQTKGSGVCGRGCGGRERGFRDTTTRNNKLLYR
jgi:hypothetical protein